MPLHRFWFGASQSLPAGVLPPTSGDAVLRGARPPGVVRMPAGPAPRVQDGVSLPDVQQIQQLPLVQAAHVTGGGPQHVGGLIGSGHTESR